MITGLHHVLLAMPKGEEDRARMFYGSILGLVEVPKPPTLASRGGCWFRGPTVEVHLGIQDDFIPARKAHPAFTVSDLATLRERLVSAGCEVQDDDELPGVKRFHTSDPFGNRLEFIQDDAAHSA